MRVNSISSVKACSLSLKTNLMLIAGSRNNIRNTALSMRRLVSALAVST
jgi:hypothetical protein